MTATVDVFWTFRSPYAYLITPDLIGLRNDFDVVVRLRPILPISIRTPGQYSPEIRKRLDYIHLDWVRRAEYLGMRHGTPSPDPVVLDLDTMKAAEDQPHIYWLTKLGVEAERRGRGIEFAYEVSHVIWGGTPNWPEGDHIKDAAQRAHLDLAEMEKAILDSDHMGEIEDNQTALTNAGHWGVPTCVYKGEPFFGQDRIETLRWRLEQSGVPRWG